MSDASNLKELAISESGFVFDPRSGATYSLNPTARAVIDGLREGMSLERLVEHMQRKFDATTDEVRNDLLDFVQTLRRQGLLAHDFTLS